MLVFVSVVAALLVGQVAATPEFTAERAKQLVQQLSDGDSEKQREAEDALIAAGTAALEYLPDVGPETLADVESYWRQGSINVITVMSVQSLRNLAALLPAWCVHQIESTPLVTPAGRVLKEALDRYPASRTILASGPGADDMVEAIIALHKTDRGPAP